MCRRPLGRRSWQASAHRLKLQSGGRNFLVLCLPAASGYEALAELGFHSLRLLALGGLG